MGNTTHFFLGANSGQGFQNLFHRFCREDHHDLVVLKGGPGVGKSTLMRRMGAAMEAKGEQVEYLYCSGDPDSLDGVWVPRIRCAMVDGTSPHVCEPRYPAAVDRYVNLGQFYDIEAAKERREEIIRCSQSCSEAYSRAYRALSAARQIEVNRCRQAAEHFDREKLLRRGEGILHREVRGKGSGGEDRWRFLGSVTCRGEVCRFDTVRQLCPRVYVLQDSYGLAAPLLERLHAAAWDRGYAAVVCPDPEDMGAMRHLLLPELGLGFVTENERAPWQGESWRRVRVDAMVDRDWYRDNRGSLRLQRKLEQELRREALEQLSQAKKCHDLLEQQYCKGVNFNGVNALAEEEIRRWESYL